MISTVIPLQQFLEYGESVEAYNDV